MKLEPIQVKKRIMEIGLKTKCGHVASALSCTELLCLIYNADPETIVILSKGHGALAQYVILNEMGILPNEVLDTYYQDGGLSGHATYNPQYGVYASTGSLGHGLAIGIGYAIAKPTRRVVVVLGDGETDEGSVYEALRIIERLKIRNIGVVVDENGQKGFDSTESPSIAPLKPNLPAFYYSVKGEFMGDVEDTVKSHYVTVNQDMYDNWLTKINEKANEKNIG